MYLSELKKKFGNVALAGHLFSKIFGKFS